MSRRYVSLWLPHWPIERWRLAQERRSGELVGTAAPFALIQLQAGGPRLYALNAAAVARKLAPGLSLADARAVCPELEVADAELERDSKALQALALWCGRYTPWVAVDGDDGVLLDITGCAHLFGGEQALLADLETRVSTLGFTGRSAAAGNPAAAWAWARFGDGGVLSSRRTAHDLAPLPVAALRLEPATVAVLHRLGLRTVGQLEAMPAAPLMARFGPLPVERLHALMGRTRLPFVPLIEPARFAIRLSWAEPLGSDAAIVAALAHALADLTEQLDHAQAGVRRLRLELARLDGAVHRLEAATSRPSRDPIALARLFRDDLDGLDLGFGIECLILQAVATEGLTARQLTTEGREADEAEAQAALIDRLSQRLGKERVQRLAPVDSHVPERAVVAAPALTTAERKPTLMAADPDLVDGMTAHAGWPVRPPRPLRIFVRPQPAGAIAELPDHPPVRLHWRSALRVVAEADGPERIAAEWWCDADARPRDYYRLELEGGRRLWVFREGAYGEAASPRWFVHGSFH